MDVKRIMLRLPPDVHAAAQACADLDMRSLNSEIVVLLREALATRQHVEKQQQERAAKKKAPAVVGE